MPGKIQDRVLAYIGRHALLRAGDRLGLAVSGGADSVALLCLLLELRGELGVLLSVVHFNHRIRGAAADADEQFVAALAEQHGLEFHCASADVPAHAVAQGLSLETAARELRYRFFTDLLHSGAVTKIATAHTLDDQAETVLLRLLRGAGTRGLAGIYPKLSVVSCQLPVGEKGPTLRCAQDGAPTEHPHPVAPTEGETRVGHPAGIYPKLSVASCQCPEESRVASCELREDVPTLRCARDGVPGDAAEPRSTRSLHSARQQQACSGRDDRVRGAAIVRPLLEIRRPEIEAYLRGLDQGWCEDATNRDVKHARNRVRHVLLPLLEREFNPAIRQVLAETAEVARAEEEFWNHSLIGLQEGPAGQEPGATLGPKNAENAIRIDALRRLPLAVQRRLVRARAERLGIALEFEQVEKALALMETSASTVELSNGWVAERKYECVPGGSGQGAVRRSAVLVLRRQSALVGPYEYALPVPGEVRIRELGVEVRASVICPRDAGGSYNQMQLLDPHSLASDLRLRNWRPGDRYWPAHSKSARKVKELLQTRHISGLERSLWPVVVNSTDELVWMRGFPPPQRYAAAPDAEAAILIEVLAGEEEGCGA